MNLVIDAPLILGGHSFISQLGNDPAASAHDQQAIVESCLDHGISWFDTTYQPERLALGKVLNDLGRRDEATILAWNFFTDFGPGDGVGEPEYYHPGHIDIILEQLRTDYVDCLVVLPLDNSEKNNRQIELVIEWRGKGYVRSLGLWVENPAMIKLSQAANPFRFAIRPFNITAKDAAPVFAAYKTAGWETLATSPFVRGWKLDQIIAEASSRGYGEGNTLRPVLADLMLRFSLFHGNVDRVIVAMRNVEWINRNLESVCRGPLTAPELSWLQSLSADRKRRWWQRLLSRYD